MNKLFNDKNFMNLLYITGAGYITYIIYTSYIGKEAELETLKTELEKLRTELETTKSTNSEELDKLNKQIKNLERDIDIKQKIFDISKKNVSDKTIEKIKEILNMLYNLRDTNENIKNKFDIISAYDYLEGNNYTGSSVVNFDPNIYSDAMDQILREGEKIDNAELKNLYTELHESIMTNARANSGSQFGKKRKSKRSKRSKRSKKAKRIKRKSKRTRRKSKRMKRKSKRL